MPTTTLLPATATGPAPAVAGSVDPLLWVAPAPIWDDAVTDGAVGALERPRIVELDNDEFIDEFLDIIAGGDPTGLGDRAPADGAGTIGDPLVLYRPVHRRYYLVVGSLVCRRIGLPDRAVEPRGQRVSFVIRRLQGSGEQAWIPSVGSWAPVLEPGALTPGEEQHPMQSERAAPVAPGPTSALVGSADHRRMLHYGYVPVAGAASSPAPLADPLASLAGDPARAAADDPRLMEFRLRVAGPWADIGAKHALGTGIDLAEPSLYLLLDLRDWLDRYLPAVLSALVENRTLSAGTPAETLRSHLDITITVDGAARRLGRALGDLAGVVSLLSGIGTEPSTVYEVHNPPGGLPGYVDVAAGTGATNGGLVLAALTDPDPADAPAAAAQLPAELTGMVVPHTDDPAADADRHVIRLVYEHDPCAPVVSAPTAPLRFAGNYDPDAPARPIRIELPDPTHLRRFNRGVAIDMPPKLRRMLDAITPDILKDDSMGQEGSWGLGMICSFSLQIIMLVAFIVMFIFLILLNIVFWWLPFLKICFPVPKKASP